LFFDRKARCEFFDGNDFVSGFLFDQENFFWKFFKFEIWKNR